MARTPETPSVAPAFAAAGVNVNGRAASTAPVKSSPGRVPSTHSPSFRSTSRRRRFRARESRCFTASGRSESNAATYSTDWPSR